MYKHIVKRDGRIVKFNPDRITQALLEAGKSTGEFNGKVASRLTLQVINIAQDAIKRDTPTVEEIQDIVEEVLLSSRYKDTAKAFILYRDQRRQIRELTQKASVDLMDQYLQKLDWQVNENSNMAYSLQGLNNYISSELSKMYWLNKIYPREIREAHLAGDLHIHDLGILSVYCVGWDLADLLEVGFKGVSGKIESNPPKHLRSALGQVVNFFYTLQGESAGAQAFSNFDTLLAPFIRYDQLTYEQVKQALQEFAFNINVPTRVGFQTPFTNITLDLVVPEIYENTPVVIGGERKEETYKEFQNEMDTFNEALFEVLETGDAKGRVFTFPIPTINITKNFDWDNPKLNNLWNITAKYGIPYFSNFINSDMDAGDVRSMCCRLRLDTRRLEKRGGGLFGANPLTGSIGVVTINMPRLGYCSKNKSEFLGNLGNLMDLAKNSLEIKREVLEVLIEKGLYPYTQYYLRNIEKRFNQYWKNHFSTIGLVGMNEACLNMFGYGVDTLAGQGFSREVLDFMRDKMVTYQQETGNNYNLEATPAEGTSYRLAKIDKEKFKDIKCANYAVCQNDREPYYTNSSQLPVHYSDDLFEVLDLQDEIQTRYTGGTVVHLFVGEKLNDFSTVKKLVKTICENYRLPYFTLTPTFSVCPDHGYISGEAFQCPQCEKDCEVYSRVVGYLRPIQQWNKGKQEEYKNRRTIKIPVMDNT